MSNGLLILVLSLVAWSGANAGQFRSVYTDNINKLSWSKALPGEYSNGCVNSDGRWDSSKCTLENGANGTLEVKLEDSNAAKACRNIGARLPTEREYDSLIQNFPHTKKQCFWDAAKTCSRLTPQGIEYMQSVFGDMNNLFWSSSVDSKNPLVAFDFDGREGDIYYAYRNINYKAVRCVSSR